MNQWFPVWWGNLFGKPNNAEALQAMELVKVIFQWLNLAAVVAVLMVFWKGYRDLKAKRVEMLSSQDAVETVGGYCMVLWWAAGTAVLWVFEVNPFWILAWMFVGAVAGVIVHHLCDVTGLSLYIRACEVYRDQLAREIEDRFAGATDDRVGDK